MIVAYADGAGLGHLTRLRAARHTLGLTGPLTVVTASRHAEDGRVAGDLEVVAPPHPRRDREGRRRWLAGVLGDLRPDLVLVDAFPAGLAGELDARSVPTGVPAVHLARLLRWPDYAAVLPAKPLRFERTYRLEPLAADHDRHLRAVSAAVVDLELEDPPGDTVAAARDRSVAGWDDQGGRHPDAAGEAQPRWLVAHAGPVAEVEELVAYARAQAAAEGVRPVLAVVTPPDVAPDPAPDLVRVDRYPATALFGRADRVFTAAGFNAMRQLAPWRSRHRFLPMPRRYDDQVERARRVRAG